LLDHKKTKMNQTKKQTIKTILIGIIVLPLIGVLYDAYSGFHVLRNSKSIYGIIAGLMVTVILALVGEYFSEVINSKDKVTDPLYKRAFHLIILLAVVGAVGFLYWFIFRYFEILKI
jgi:amino acid transporter